MFCPEGSSYPRECPIDNPNCWVDKVPNEIETVTDTGKRNLQTCTGGNYWDGYNCQTWPEGYTWAAGTNITPSRCGTDTYSAAGATSCTVRLKFIMFLDFFMILKRSWWKLNMLRFIIL